MQVLLLQDREEVREKVVFFIESTFGAKVHEANTLANGLGILRTAQPPIELIILDTKKGPSEELKQFNQASSKIPTLLCVQGAGDPSLMKGNVVGLVDRTSLMENIVSAIDDLTEKGIIHQQKPEQGQCRIKTKLLLSVCPLKGDIYIKLSENKFVKVFREGDVFDLQDLEKYTIKKGVEYLYIRKDQCSEFSQKYLTELQKMLASPKPITVEEVSRLGTSVNETVRELAKQVGFTKDIQEMAKTQVQLTVKAMGKDPNLTEILKRLKTSEGKYISNHSNLCAFIACAIAAQLKWGSETTFYKLSLASFLHDITLENEDLATLTSLEELEQKKSNFTEDEQKDFKNHPATAAEMAKGMSEVPPDVDTIIRQHHEKPDGTGFPRGISHTYIAPLSSVFIVAHELTQDLLLNSYDFNPEAFINKVRDKYKSSQFKKVMTCIESLGKLKELAAEMRLK